MRPLSIAWLQDVGHDARFAARTALKVVSVRSVGGAGRPVGASYADVGDWIGAATSFDAMSATATAAMTLTDRDRPAERVAGAYVSAGTFAMVGERPILGRDFRREDDRPGAAPVAIVNASIWKNRYGGDAAIVGRSIDVNGVATTIVGVMRDGFRFPLVHDVWQPLASMPGITSGARDARTLRVAARLAHGRTMAAARQEMDAIAARLAAAYPATNANVRTAIEPYTGRFELANPWNAMLAAVSIVLLIACANIANLLISRAAYRTREIAIRRTLGATRWRLVRQLLVENLLLAFAGGAAGVFVAIAGVRVWLASMPEANWPYWYHFAVDRRVLAYIVEVAVGAALVFGIGPALYLSKRDPAAQLTDRSHATSAAPIARRWSNALLAGQFALTLALLAGAVLLARTLVAVYRADAKVETSHVLLSGIDLPPEKYSTPQRRVALYTALEERVAAMSGVDAAGLASDAPFYTAPVWSVSIDGSPPTDPVAASYVAIGARYFDALRLRPRRGRVFSDRDGTPGFDTAIVNELFASRYFRGDDALGRRIRLADPAHPDPSARWLTIVGITPTVRQHYAEEIDAVVYVPYRSNPAAGMVLLTRASGDPAALTPALREQVHQLDPDLPLVDVRTLTSLVDGTRFANKVFAAMFSIAAVLGLLLAAIGLHAVTVYAIARRTVEIGVRMALGARASQVIWLLV
ncbi:MAG: ABC transporter permease, partial [Acidobacteria bacterium]|nr:ABC transporter permease [Acidobacteriota bacterium]